MVSFTNFINEYNNFTNKYYTAFLDSIMVKEALNIISGFNLKIGEFKKRTENLATRLNSQNLSASEMESINNMAGQLLSDIDAQRYAMLKQRISIVEKACVVVEKKIAETQQTIAGYDDTNIKSDIDKANEYIMEVKQHIDKAKTSNDEDQLLSAEYVIVSAEARQQSAEHERRSAEYERQSAEAIESSKKSTLKGLEALVVFYSYYIEDP